MSRMGRVVLSLWAHFVLLIALLPSSTVQFAKLFTNHSMSGTRPLFVVNFEMATVICQHSTDPTDFHVHEMSILCDGKQDCFPSAALHDESFAYCRPGQCDGMTCSNRGACLFDGEKPRCFCDRGTHGKNCELAEPNSCADTPCHPTAQCQWESELNACQCHSGFRGNGTFCEDIDECAEDTAKCPEQSHCVNLPGTFICNCTDGFTPVGTPVERCVDIDECEKDNNCGEGMRCQNEIGSYSCGPSCSPGFTPDHKDRCVDVDECLGSPCHSRAECMNTLGGFECLCLEGYRGDGFLCEDIDECAAHDNLCVGKSEGHTKCVNLNGGFVCCDSLKADSDCIADKDTLCSGGCGKNAECLNQTCRCPPGFTGDPLRRCHDIDECLAGGDVCAGVHQWCVNLPGAHVCCSSDNDRPECKKRKGKTMLQSKGGARARARVRLHLAGETPEEEAPSAEDEVSEGGQRREESGGSLFVLHRDKVNNASANETGTQISSPGRFQIPATNIQSPFPLCAPFAATSVCPEKANCVGGFCKCNIGFSWNGAECKEQTGTGEEGKGEQGQPQHEGTERQPSAGEGEPETRGESGSESSGQIGIVVVGKGGTRKQHSNAGKEGGGFGAGSGEGGGRLDGDIQNGQAPEGEQKPDSTRTDENQRPRKEEPFGGGGRLSASAGREAGQQSKGEISIWLVGGGAKEAEEPKERDHHQGRGGETQEQGGAHPGGAESGGGLEGLEEAIGPNGRDKEGHIKTEDEKAGAEEVAAAVEADNNPKVPPLHKQPDGDGGETGEESRGEIGIWLVGRKGKEKTTDEGDNGNEELGSRRKEVEAPSEAKKSGKSKGGGGMAGMAESGLTLRKESDEELGGEGGTADLENGAKGDGSGQKTEGRTTPAEEEAGLEIGRGIGIAEEDAKATAGPNAASELSENVAMTTKRNGLTVIDAEKEPNWIWKEGEGDKMTTMQSGREEEDGGLSGEGETNGATTTAGGGIWDEKTQRGGAIKAGIDEPTTAVPPLRIRPSPYANVSSTRPPAEEGTFQPGSTMTFELDTTTTAEDGELGLVIGRWIAPEEGGGKESRTSTSHNPSTTDRTIELVTEGEENGSTAPIEGVGQRREETSTKGTQTTKERLSTEDRGLAGTISSVVSSGQRSTTEQIEETTNKYQTARSTMQVERRVVTGDYELGVGSTRQSKEGTTPVLEGGESSTVEGASTNGLRVEIDGGEEPEGGEREGLRKKGTVVLGSSTVPSTVGEGKTSGQEATTEGGRGREESSTRREEAATEPATETGGFTTPGNGDPATSERIGGTTRGDGEATPSKEPEVASTDRATGMTTESSGGSSTDTPPPPVALTSSAPSQSSTSEVPLLEAGSTPAAEGPTEHSTPSPPIVVDEASSLPPPGVSSSATGTPPSDGFISTSTSSREEVERPEGERNGQERATIATSTSHEEPFVTYPPQSTNESSTPSDTSTPSSVAPGEEKSTVSSIQLSSSPTISNVMTEINVFSSIKPTDEPEKGLEIGKWVPEGEGTMRQSNATTAAASQHSTPLSTTYSGEGTTSTTGQTTAVTAPVGTLAASQTVSPESSRPSSAGLTSSAEEEGTTTDKGTEPVLTSSLATIVSSSSETSTSSSSSQSILPEQRPTSSIVPSETGPIASSTLAENTTSAAVQSSTNLPPSSESARQSGTSPMPPTTFDRSNVPRPTGEPERGLEIGPERRQESTNQTAPPTPASTTIAQPVSITVAPPTPTAGSSTPAESSQSKNTVLPTEIPSRVATSRGPTSEGPTSAKPLPSSSVVSENESQTTSGTTTLHEGATTEKGEGLEIGRLPEKEKEGKEDGDWTILVGEEEGKETRTTPGGTETSTWRTTAGGRTTAEGDPEDASMSPSPIATTELFVQSTLSERTSSPPSTNEWTTPNAVGLEETSSTLGEDATTSNLGGENKTTNGGIEISTEETPSTNGLRVEIDGGEEPEGGEREGLRKKATTTEAQALTKGSVGGSSATSPQPSPELSVSTTMANSNSTPEPVPTSEGTTEQSTMAPPVPTTPSSAASPSPKVHLTGPTAEQQSTTPSGEVGREQTSTPLPHDEIPTKTQGTEGPSGTTPANEPFSSTLPESKTTETAEEWGLEVGSSSQSPTTSEGEGSSTNGGTTTPASGSIHTQSSLSTKDLYSPTSPPIAPSTQTSEATKGWHASSAVGSVEAESKATTRGTTTEEGRATDGASSSAPADKEEETSSPRMSTEHIPLATADQTTDSELFTSPSGSATPSETTEKVAETTLSASKMGKETTLTGGEGSEQTTSGTPVAIYTTEDGRETQRKTTSEEEGGPNGSTMQVERRVVTGDYELGVGSTRQSKEGTTPVLEGGESSTVEGASTNGLRVEIDGGEEPEGGEREGLRKKGTVVLGSSTVPSTVGEGKTSGQEATTEGGRGREESSTRREEAATEPATETGGFTTPGNGDPATSERIGGTTRGDGEATPSKEPEVASTDRATGMTTESSGGSSTDTPPPPVALTSSAPSQSSTSEVPLLEAGSTPAAEGPTEHSTPSPPIVVDEASSLPPPGVSSSATEIYDRLSSVGTSRKPAVQSEGRTTEGMEGTTVDEGEWGLEIGSSRTPEEATATTETGKQQSSTPALPTTSQPSSSLSPSTGTTSTHRLHSSTGSASPSSPFTSPPTTEGTTSRPQPQTHSRSSQSTPAYSPHTTPASTTSSAYTSPTTPRATTKDTFPLVTSAGTKGPIQSSTTASSPSTLPAPASTRPSSSTPPPQSSSLSTAPASERTSQSSSTSPPPPSPSTTVLRNRSSTSPPSIVIPTGSTRPTQLPRSSPTPQPDPRRTAQTAASPSAMTPSTSAPSARPTATSTGDLFSLSTSPTPRTAPSPQFRCQSRDQCGRDAYCEHRTGSCRCLAGFTGHPPFSACTDVDECAQRLDECHATAQCHNFVGGYVCLCAVGFRRGVDGLCQDIDECAEMGSSACHPDAACRNLPGTFSCQCNTGFSGDGYTCLPLAQRQCLPAEWVMADCGRNHLCVVDETGTPNCGHCKKGFRMSHGACTDINECAEPTGSQHRHRCHPMAQCENTMGAHRCVCRTGFAGSGWHCEDVDECGGAMAVVPEERVSRPRWPLHLASNGALSLGGAAAAVALQPRSGLSSPAALCHPQAQCRNTEGSFRCECPRGWRGNALSSQCVHPSAVQCGGCAPLAHCLSIPHFDDGQFRRICECSPNTRFDQRERKCIDVDECAENRHNCDPHTSDCVNVDSGRGYECRCRTGFEGTGGQCVDVDECQSGVAQCHPNAHCENLVGSFTCHCAPGFSGNGMHCSPLSPSPPSPTPFATESPPLCPPEWREMCLAANKTCFVDDEEMPQCGSCLFGFHPMGGKCELINSVGNCADPSKNNCHRHADCIDVTPATHFCSCRSGFIGDGIRCDDVDECSIAGICDPNADCRNLVGSYECACGPEYTGNGHKCVRLAKESATTDGGGGTPASTPPPSTTVQTTATVSQETRTQDGKWGLEIGTTVEPGSGEQTEQTYRTPSQRTQSARSPSPTTASPPTPRATTKDTFPLGLTGTTGGPPRPVHPGSSSPSPPTSSTQPATTHSLSSSTRTTKDTFRLGTTRPNNNIVGNRTPFPPLSLSSSSPPSLSTHSAPLRHNLSSTSLPPFGRCSAHSQCHPLAVCRLPEGICRCANGLHGDGVSQCTNECSPFESPSSVCARNAECSPQTRICQCRLGFVGDGYSECLPDRWDCVARGPFLCSEFAHCVDRRCVCRPGFVGDGTICVQSELPTEWRRNCLACHCKASCVQGECRCNEGYLGNGLLCVPDPRDCLNYPSLCHPTNAFCDQDRRRCQCRRGFSGDGVTIVRTPKPQTFPVAFSTVCRLSNSCLSGGPACHPMAICMSSGECRCTNGFAGDGWQNCERERDGYVVGRPLNVSRSGPMPTCSRAYGKCPGNAECVNGACKCGSGFVENQDGFCQDIDECRMGLASCAPQANCQNLEGAYRCECPEGMYGDGRECSGEEEQQHHFDSVECLPEAMVVQLGEGFRGRIFVKGQRENPLCSKEFGGTEKLPLEFHIPLKHCHTQMDSNNTMTALVFVQRHPTFITARSLSYRVQCHYPLHARQFQTSLRVNELAPLASLASQGTEPICMLEVNDERGERVQTAFVGQSLTLTLSVSPNSTFSILPRSCFVVNLELEQRHALTDAAGCAVDSTLFPEWTQISPHQTKATFRTFKWPESNLIRFECDCAACLGPCPLIDCGKQRKAFIRQKSAHRFARESEAEDELEIGHDLVRTSKASLAQSAAFYIAGESRKMRKRHTHSSIHEQNPPIEISPNTRNQITEIYWAAGTYFCVALSSAIIFYFILHRCCLRDRSEDSTKSTNSSPSSAKKFGRYQPRQSFEIDTQHCPHSAMP